MSEEKSFNKFHNIILENRNIMNISGVEDVDSFDENTVVVFTQLGVLVIKGENLHINRFSIEGGELSIEGKIYSAAYKDDASPKTQGGFFAKMFK